MTKLAISVSFCADHRKGDGQIMDPWEHWHMLQGTLDYLGEEAESTLITVAAGGYGWGAGCMVVARPDNPGYLEGATWAIGAAVGVAKSIGCEFLVHTCEDCVPNRGVIAHMVRLMEQDNLDYIGERWRDETVNELSTQFFGCRVAYMAEQFNGNGENGLLAEAYMGEVMKGRKIGLMSREYAHTHTFSEYQRLLVEARS